MFLMKNKLNKRQLKNLSTCLPSVKVSIGAGYYRVFQDLHSYQSLKFSWAASLDLFLWVGSLVFCFYGSEWSKNVSPHSDGQRIKWLS